MNLETSGKLYHRAIELLAMSIIEQWKVHTHKGAMEGSSAAYMSLNDYLSRSQKHIMKTLHERASELV